MATRSIVPRATGEGGIGTAAKKWGLGWINALVVVTINALTVTAQATGFTITGGTTSKTLTVDADFTTSTGVEFAAGTKMLFYADTAPTGWTIQNTLDDKVVYVTKGSAAGGQTGGGVHSTGTWTQPGHQHTHAAFTLTINEMPAHTHTQYYHATGTDRNALKASTTDVTEATGSTGGGAAHTHPNAAAAATANTWRPAAYAMIICSKN